MKKENLLLYGTLVSALLPVIPVTAKTQKGNPSVDNRQQPNFCLLQRQSWMITHFYI